MYWTVLLAAVALLFLGGACTPSLAQSEIPITGGGAATSPTAAVPPEPMSPVKQAEAIIGARFQGLGWIESIVTVQYQDKTIRLTMQRDTFTLGNLEAYTRMCQALTELIGTDGATGEILAIQTFRADGSPVVSGTVNGEPCTPSTG